LMFLSVNGTAESYGTAQGVPSRYITPPPVAAGPASGAGPAARVHGVARNVTTSVGGLSPFSRPK
jgi:hypothetical protein